MMKKLLPALILISVLAVLIVPAVSLAIDKEVPTGCTMTKDVGLGTAVCPTSGECSYTNPAVTTYKCGICCTLNTIYNIVDWFFVALIAIAGFFVLMGALTFLTSAGSPEGTTKGRNYIMYAAIGVGLAFLAKALPSIVKTIIGA